jgi:C1A family cysteine protease
MPEHAYGRIQDLADFRDFRLTPPPAPDGGLPASMDLRGSPFMPPIWDQGQLGACVAFGTDAIICFLRAKLGLPAITPSHLFQYYNARSLEGTTRVDSGSSIRDGIKAAAKYGTAPEADWPYDIAKFTQKPPKPSYTDAVKHKALVYQQVPQTADAIKRVLASGLPLTFGITVYESFESAAADKTGDIPMPHRGEKVLGGHDLDAVGYDPQWVIFRNHWSPSWGDSGFGRLPWAYVLSKIASDFWVISQESA